MQETRITLSVSVDDEEDLLTTLETFNRVMASLALGGFQPSLVAGPDPWDAENEYVDRVDSDEEEK